MKGNEEGRRRNRVTYRSRAQVSDMCMKNEMMREKMLDEKCPVRDDERGRESESVQSFKNEVSMLCEKSQMQILWNPVNENYIVSRN